MKERDPIIESMSENAVELLSDVAELSLDSILERILSDNKLLEEIPVVKWLVIGNNFRNAIQTAFFIRKWALFIGPLKNDFRSSESYKELLDSAINDLKRQTRIIENTILSIERYRNDNLAKLLGDLFVRTIKYNDFSIKEYNTLLFSLDMMHPYIGLETLRNFYEYKVKMDNEENSENKSKIWGEHASMDYSALSNTLLLILPHGGSYAGDAGGAFINDLGFRFYEKVIIGCDNIALTIAST